MRRPAVHSLSVPQALSHLLQATPPPPHLSLEVPDSQVFPAQQPVQEFLVQVQEPLTHSCPGPQGLLLPHLHCPLMHRSTFSPVQAGPVPHTHTPRSSQALARTASHSMQLRPPLPHVRNWEVVQ